MKNKRQTVSTIKTLKRIFKYIGKYKGYFTLVIIFTILSTCAVVTSTYFTKPLISGYIEPIAQGNGTVSMGDFAQGLLLVSGIYFIGVISTLIYGRLMLIVANNVMNNVRTDLFTKMQTLPISFFDTHTHGELMSLYTNNTDTLREFISEVLPNIISSFLLLIGSLTMMIILSPLLTLLTFVFLVAMMIIIRFVGGKSHLYFQTRQKVFGELSGYIEEMIEGQRVVKIFNHEEEALGEYNKHNERFRVATKNANSYAIMLFPLMGNLSYIQYIMTILIGAWMVQKGITGLEIASLVTFMLFIRSFSRPITMISQQFNAIFMALAGAEKIFAVIDTTHEYDEGYVELVNITNIDGKIAEVDYSTSNWAWKYPHSNGEITYSLLKGDVVLENVNFGYSERKLVLRDVSLHAYPGQKIAFVGSTGAGKTTITNLLNRFYEITEGKIRYDGINIRKIKKTDLRRSLSMVLQETHLFTGSVMENIRFGKLDATNEEVMTAAKLANADSFVSHLPDGYQTILTADGANLSQGQRQLLAIARAAIANPPVLILDEATSSIDTRTERLIEVGMDQLMKGRTVFVIAHRLSTVRNADLIIVLEHGQIIEQGTHDELIAQKGKYHQLYTGMFELE